MRRGRHATRRASQQPSLHLTMMIGDETSCARVQVLPTGCFYFEGVLDFCCTFPGGESRGHVDGSVPRVCLRDGRWECLKPANCYRFIGTHVPERKEDHRGRSSVTADVVIGSIEWSISNYGEPRPSSRNNYITIVMRHIYIYICDIFEGKRVM